MSVTISPPANEVPLDADGRHNQAWASYHQSVAEQVTALQRNAGVTDGSDAAAGRVGEYLSATGSGISLSNGVPADVVTLALTAGDWDVSGNAIFNTTGVVTLVAAGVSTASAAFGSVANANGGALGTALQHRIGTGGPVRINITSAATAYLVAQCNFSTGSVTALGLIWARRVR